jgi:hypothetical protein
MPLPRSRNTTYTPEAPVKSFDLNDLQDCSIRGAHGDQRINIPAANGYAYTDANWQREGGNVIWGGSGGPSAAHSWFVPIELPVGAVITSVIWFFLRTSSVNLELSASDLLAGGTSFTPVTISSGTGAASQALTHPNPDGFTIPTLGSLTAIATLTGAGSTYLNSVSVLYYQP